MALIPYSVKLRIGYAEMNELYHALRIPDKLREGTLTADYITGTARPADIYPGGVSAIERLLNGARAQIGTRHRVYDPSGRILHEDPESLVIGEVLLWRRGHD